MGNFCMSHCCHQHSLFVETIKANRVRNNVDCIQKQTKEN